MKNTVVTLWESEIIKVLLLTASDVVEPHAGCILVDEAFEYLFTRHGMHMVGRLCKKELIYSEKDRCYLNLKASVQTQKVPIFDLVVVNAEGATHHNAWPPLIQVAEDYSAVLINAVWQDNSYDHSLDKFLYLSARESISAALMGYDTQVVPDVSFVAPSLCKRVRYTPRIGSVTTCSVRWDRGGWKPDFKITSLDFISILDRAARVTTGRFHGAVIAASLGIPFTAYPSNTHKIEGMLKDMGVSDNYYPTRVIAEENDPVHTDRVADYVRSAPDKIDRMFEDIKSAYYGRLSAPTKASKKNPH